MQLLLGGTSGGGGGGNGGVEVSTDNCRRQHHRAMTPSNLERVFSYFQDPRDRERSRPTNDDVMAWIARGSGGRRGVGEGDAVKHPGCVTGQGTPKASMVVGNVDGYSKKPLRDVLAHFQGYYECSCVGQGEGMEETVEGILRGGCADSGSLPSWSGEVSLATRRPKKKCTVM